jgi:hypothetical protein
MSYFQNATAVHFFTAMRLTGGTFDLRRSVVIVVCLALVCEFVVCVACGDDVSPESWRRCAVACVVEREMWMETGGWPGKKGSRRDGWGARDTHFAAGASAGALIADVVCFRKSVEVGEVEVKLID